MLLLFSVGPDLEADSILDVDRGDTLTTPRGTHGLVHLRNGKQLADYGLVTDSLVYVCFDNK